MEERQEAAMFAAAVRIQNECALTYMNASSRQNLSDALMANENVTRTRVEPHGALDGVTDRARLRRTNVTMHSGRERPPSERALGRRRGQQSGGRSRPTCLNGGSDGCTGCDTGGTERRPVAFVEVADCQRPA